MSQRYLLIVGTGNSARQDLLAELAGSTGLTLACSFERMAALAAPGCACVSVDGTGCILGSLFHRHGVADRVANLTASDQSSITASEGQLLLTRFWGGYVAAIATPHGVRILRDPSGTLSCYHARRAGFLLVASDAELLARAGVVADVDIEEIGRQLYRAFVPASSTALRGVDELLAGFAIRAEESVSGQEPCWSPWDHVEDRSGSPEQMTESLHRIVRHCTRAWASTSVRLLLSVSGGLDSSILAACLAGAGSNATCLTMFAGDPAGDERMYARALCDHLALPLIEWPYRLEDIDITEPLGAHLPRPRDRTQANAYERVHLEVAREIGSDAFMTGNGGDSVFGYSQSAAPVADLYLTDGLRRRTARALLDVCRQTGCNIFDALRQAWELAHRPADFRVAPKPLLLSPEFVAGIRPDVLHHPWLDALAGSLPGKAAQIASILRVQSHLEASRGRHIPLLSPLMSQPIVEMCLSIPSWEWRAGGRDRSVARRAFAAELPPVVVSRQVKGSPSGFGARLLDHFRVSIRERLLGGRLVSRGIVDKSAIEIILAGNKPVPHAERVRILELVNAEAWLDHWNGRQAAEPAEANVSRPAYGLCRSSARPTL